MRSGLPGEVRAKPDGETRSKENPEEDIGFFQKKLKNFNHEMNAHEREQN